MTPTLAPLNEAASGSGLSWAVKDTIAIVKRNLITIVRLPQLLVFATVQPVIFVFMFRYVFGGAIATPGYHYVDYLMPGVFAQTVTFGAINTAIGLAEDKNKGLLERMRSLPMARSAVLGGRTVADLVKNALVIVLMVIVGTLVGFRIHEGVGKFLLGLLVLLLFAFALAWLFALIGLSVSNGEAAQAASFPMLAPLVFASNAFVPTKTMPSWLRWWADHQPFSAVVSAVRASVQTIPGGKSFGSAALLAVAWSLGLIIVLAPLAVRKYRKS